MFATVAQNAIQNVNSPTSKVRTVLRRRVARRMFRIAIAELDATRAEHFRTVRNFEPRARSTEF